MQTLLHLLDFHDVIHNCPICLPATTSLIVRVDCCVKLEAGAWDGAVVAAA